MSKQIAKNPVARHNYEIIDTLERYRILLYISHIIYDLSYL